MKKLLSVVAVASLVQLSLDAHSRLGANGSSLNGVGLHGADQILNLRSLAQAPLVKAP